MGSSRRGSRAAWLAIAMALPAAYLIGFLSARKPGDQVLVAPTAGPSETRAPAGRAGTRNASGDPKPVAAWKALQCLNVICDTGASEASVSDARRLMSELAGNTQSFAPPLRAALNSVLIHLDGGGQEVSAGVPAAFLTEFPDLSEDLLHRATAACHERGRRKPDEIVLSFAGDCSFGTVNGDNRRIRFPSVYERAGFLEYPFANMRPWFFNDDLTVVNYEGTLTEAVRTADKEWRFRGAPAYAAVFPASSVEAAGLSNNHSQDYLDRGFRDTSKALLEEHVGVFHQETPCIATYKGVEVVLIGDCTVVGENTTVTEGVAERVTGEIREYKHADNIVIVVMHWGSELDTVPTPWQREHGRQFIAAGADAVVGHHPHVVQGIECYQGRYIAYSLGNFAFGGNSLTRHPETLVLRLRFGVRGGKPVVAGASIVPCQVTSTEKRNRKGTLRNNYQPKPVFGREAARTAALLIERSAGLEYGVKAMEYLDLK